MGRDMGPILDEIRQLKEERDIAVEGFRQQVALAGDAIERAIQAEQERDSRYEFDKQRTIRLEEERNALLELLRYFVERTTIDHSYTHTLEYAKARSIIAKLEEE